MNKHLLCLLANLILSFTINFTHAQTAKDLVGSWKVISFGNKELLMDLKNESYEGETVSALDSSLSKALFSAMNASLGNMIYSFNKKGKYKLTTNDELKEEGTFKVDRKKSLFIFSTTRNDQKVEDEYRFVFQKNKLILTDSDEEIPMTLTLEKQD